MKKNFYDILGVAKTVTADEIKGVFRELAKKYHPDVNNSSNAAKQFKEIHEAYAILSNPFERKLYDESLVSPKIPKDIFSTPKYAYASAQPTEEELRKQAEIRKYRKHLIIQAVMRVVLNSLAGLAGGYILISLLQIMQEKSLQISLISLAQFGGIIAGLFLGFIWSIDRYFKIETFISKPFYRKMFRHFRTAAFALAFTYLFAFLWSTLTGFNLQQNPGLTAGVFCLLFLITTTFASDGEMRNRIYKGNFLAILIVFWHNFLIGLGGAVLGLIIGIIFYLTDQDIFLLYLASLFGFIFALLLGSVAPQDLELITQKINQVTRSMIYLIIIAVVFVVGISMGIFIQGALT